MQVQIKCQQRWFEAQQKACELHDHTLQECICRVISFATCKDWYIEECKKKSDRAYAAFNRILELWFKARDTDNPEVYRRATKLKWRLWEKYKIESDKYHDAVNGGNSILYITSDHEKYSFYWYIEAPFTGWHDSRYLNNEYIMHMNGGIIFHGDHWQTHT